VKDDVCMAAVTGYKGTVLGSEGTEAEVLEVPLQVHDVVPETWGTEDHQRRVWAGDDDGDDDDDVLLSNSSCVVIVMSCSMEDALVSVA